MTAAIRLSGAQRSRAACVLAVGCNWGALVRRPSDLGFDDSAYELPKLHPQ